MNLRCKTSELDLDQAQVSACVPQAHWWKESERNGRNRSPPSHTALCSLVHLRSFLRSIFEEDLLQSSLANLPPYCSVKELTETKLNRYYTTNSYDFSKYQFLANILLIAFIRALSYYK